MLLRMMPANVRDALPVMHAEFMKPAIGAMRVGEDLPQALVKSRFAAVRDVYIAIISARRRSGPIIASMKTDVTVRDGRVK